MFNRDYFEIIGDAMDEIAEEEILNMLSDDGFFDEPDPTDEDLEMMYKDYITPPAYDEVVEEMYKNYLNQPNAYKVPLL